jgi:hypothetical protein
VFLVALGFLAVTAASPALPSVTVQTLSGERVVLPRDLTQLSIFVAGFSKSSRAETEPWARRLRDDPRVSTKARIYEVSIFDGVPGFLRGMILSQMKSGVAADRQKQFLIVTESIDAWKRALDSAGSDDHAYVIVVHPTGAVIWRGHGAVADPAFQSLLDAIAKALAK